METVFDIEFEGQLDRTRLGRLQKLLDLEPVGRLTDTEDGQFGHRALSDLPEAWVWLDLWRRPSSGWAITLTYGGPRPSGPVIAQCQAQVQAAAGVLGLAVTRTRPEPTEPVRAPDRLELPSRRALSVRLAGGQRLGGWLDVDALHRLQGGLHLRRELGGVSGSEFGWRYVRWDPPTGSELLQLYDDPAAGTEIALLFDRQPPTEEVVAGCRLQIEVAAAQARMTLAEQHPEPAGEATTHDWAAVARRAAGAETLSELFRVLGWSNETAYELTRGRLLVVTNQPEWTAAQPRLRQQAEDLLLGLPVGQI
jgi:hypothetical protein